MPKTPTRRAALEQRGTIVCIAHVPIAKPTKSIVCSPFGEAGWVGNRE